MQNGETLDFFCLNDAEVKSVNNQDVKHERTCLAYQAERVVNNTENSNIFAIGDGYCEKKSFGGSFVCEFQEK